MKFRIISALVASAAILPFAAQAEGLSYSYLEAGYLNTDLDESSETVGGWGLKGSWEFIDNWFAYGRYADQKTDVARRRDHVPAVGHRRRLCVADRRADGHLRHGRLRQLRPRRPERRSASRTRATTATRWAPAFARASRSSFELEGTSSTQNLSDYGDEFDFGV